MEDTGTRLLAFAAAIVPAFIVFYYFIIAAKVRVDSDMIWSAFGFGAGAAFPAIVVAKFIEVNIGFGTEAYEISANQAFWGAAIPEEAFKLLAVLCVCWKELKDFTPKHLFTLAVGCACGFACFENIFYVIESKGWYFTAIYRSISAVPGHAFVGALMGYFIVRAVRSSFSWLWWALSLLLPIALHGAYDFFLFATDYMEAMHVGTLTDSTQLLVLGFVITVILEGLFAHWALYAVMKIGDVELKANSIARKQLDKGIIQRIGEGPALWLVLGVACFLGTLMLMIVLNNAAENAKKYMGIGFATIFAFHGVAFVALAGVLSRRKKQCVSVAP